MMWLASLLILISLGGSYGDFDCYLAEQRQCREDLLPTKFPETTEEFLKTCRAVEQLGNCVADASESCTYNEEETNAIRHTVDYISATCQEGNPIFEVLSSNLDCLENALPKIMTEPCMGPFSETGREAITEHFKPLIENEQHEQLQCLEEMMYVGCRAIRFERQCGESVGEAIADVIINFKDASSRCTPELIEEVLPLLEGLEAVIGEEMEQWLRKRR